MVKRIMGKKIETITNKLTKYDIHCDNEYELRQLFDNMDKQHQLENHNHLHSLF